MVVDWDSILLQNWQPELSVEIKGFISKSCHQKLRSDISLRTYFKAAKLTLLSPPWPHFSSITNSAHPLLKQTKQIKTKILEKRAEEEDTRGFGRIESLVQRLFFHLPEPPPAPREKEKRCQEDPPPFTPAPAAKHGVPAREKARYSLWDIYLCSRPPKWLLGPTREEVEGNWERW